MHVTEQDYELLSQYLDGELSPVETSQLEQRLTAELGLQACLTELQTLQGRLQNIYSDAAVGPVPANISALLQDSPARTVPLPQRRVAIWGLALAASLVVAVAATQLAQQNQQPDMNSALSVALDNSPSRSSGWETLSDGRRVRPILSFQGTSGAWCREYLLTDGNADWHGVACRNDGTWATAVLASTKIMAITTEYRPAGAGDSDAIAAFIDENAADIPLDARQEAELIARSWQ
tara:strand:- start:76946 stop:77650 length:705 start_codon:yes stop_codon:yes gene_type:complete